MVILLPELQNHHFPNALTTKYAKLDFLTMHFAFTFLLLVFVSGCCDSSRNGVKETSNAFWKTASKGGKIIHAGKLARKIHGHLTSAMLRTNPNSKLARKNQFAWLYLHGPYKDVMYENDIVRNVLLGTDPFPTVTSQWPENAFETNLLFAIPEKEAFGNPTDNSGHPEHKVLQYLEEMRLGFLDRNEVCPYYGIVGSVRDPCRFSNIETVSLIRNYSMLVNIQNS